MMSLRVRYVSPSYPMHRVSADGWAGPLGRLCGRRELCAAGGGVGDRCGCGVPRASHTKMKAVKVGGASCVSRGRFARGVGIVKPSRRMCIPDETIG